MHVCLMLNVCARLSSVAKECVEGPHPLRKCGGTAVVCVVLHDYDKAHQEMRSFEKECMCQSADGRHAQAPG
jgi:hypothetical protein